MDGLSYWLQSSMHRVYPATPSADCRTLDLLAARHERLSFQVCVRNETLDPVTVKAVIGDRDGLGIRVRRVGYVPMRHHNTHTEFGELEGVGHVPGFVPDPLYDEDTITPAPLETHSFWINVTVPEDLAPGKYDMPIRLMVEDEVIGKLRARIDVRPFTIQPLKDFPVVHWFYADALCDWYKVEPYDKAFWRIVEPYMKDVAEHHSGMYVPIFTPPTDGIKRPQQLLKVTTPEEGRYEFDFSDVRRWVRLARKNGAKWFEWTHFVCQWGAKCALLIYRSNQDPQSLLWPPETSATSDVYRNFLAQFLPEFHKFLRKEKLLDCSIFHVSDEPHADHLEDYRQAREMLRELAPWMNVADALSDIEFGLQKLTDMPIPILTSAKAFTEAGIPAMVYFCCGPRNKYLNRLMDTPLAKIRMSGWLFYKLGAKGFLHWGYNYWYRSGSKELIDPFTEQSAANWPRWPYGDTFVVYPGPDGPLDSIRWEAFAESLQDYALLQTAGVDAGDPLLADIEGYDEFPKNGDWIVEARRKILGG